MPFIETSDRTSLFYKDWGTGKPVLFLHGWCLGANMWEYQMTPLADRGLRCIAYDARGCGRSDQPGITTHHKHGLRRAEPLTKTAAACCAWS